MSLRKTKTHVEEIVRYILQNVHIIRKFGGRWESVEVNENVNTDKMKNSSRQSLDICVCYSDGFHGQKIDLVL